MAVGLGDGEVGGPLGEPLGTGLGVGAVDATGDVDGAGLAAWAPGVGTASGRIAVPIAIAAISVGSSATATKTIDRVRLIRGSRQGRRLAAQGRRR